MFQGRSTQMLFLYARTSAHLGVALLNDLPDFDLICESFKRNQMAKVFSLKQVHARVLDQPWSATNPQ